MTKFTNQKSLAASIFDVFGNGAPTLHQWEIMHHSICEWMNEEAESLQRWRIKLEEEQPEGWQKKAYSSKIRQQNYLAAATFISKIYAALLSERHRSVGIMNDLKKVDKQTKSYHIWAITFQQTMNDLVAENEIMMQASLSLAAKTASISQEQHTANIKRLLTNDSTFRSGVELMVANGINEL